MWLSWLWPFEMHKLKEIHSEFHAECVTDSRLNDTSTLSNGCGGVSILWKKSFDVTLIFEINSDGICGIRLRLTYPEMKELTLLRVYSPCVDAGIDKLCTSTLWARMFHKWGSEARARLIIDRCEMYAPSLSAVAKDPSYNFWRSSDIKTTGDYIF